MRQRSISAIGVVVAGLLPALLGGWVFAIAFTAIAAIAYLEAIRIVHPAAGRVGQIGLGVVIAGGILPMLVGASHRTGILVAIAVGLPLVAAMFLTQTDSIAGWTHTTSAALYLGLPALAAVSLRTEETHPAHDWVRDLAGLMPDVPEATGGGLAWFLLGLLVTWLSDTFAYLVGRTWGRRKLIPRISPNKTIEGAIGGLLAAGLTAVACDALFGMDIGAGWAILVGSGLGVVGMLGDLSESMLKRQRGVKDSGTLIPGHGGMLDRIDALVFVLVACWLVAPAFT